jgi:hypothetical protein
MDHNPENVSFEIEVQMKLLMQCLISFLMPIATIGNTLTGEGGIVVHEASGIAKLGDRLIIVGDDADGRYFEMMLEDQKIPVIPIDPEKIREVPLPGASMAMDLEAIDFLSDGRVVILSEQQRSLIARESITSDRYKVIIEYDKLLAEFGNRGLEGLAVERRGDGSSQVAVMWEGGYPEYDQVPDQIRALVGRFPFKPIIVVREIGSDGVVVKETDDPAEKIVLDVPEPPGEAPTAQRYRGTDLVWHRWRNEGIEGGFERGFIVLLSSLNSPPDDSGVDKKYQYKLLQRFDLQGKPVGEPLDLSRICQGILGDAVEEICKHLKPELSTHMRKVAGMIEDSDGMSVNWEGLSWFEEGVSLVTIYDTWPKDPPFAMIFDIPQEWK